MSSYCASCLADLALVRDAVTSVSGTAACVAHAVLLAHPGDNPQRRLQRLSDLRAMAEGKLATASAEDAPTIELLIQEYALAGAMDMTVPLKDLAGERTPRPPKKRRGRDRERGPREFPVETRPAEAAGLGQATGGPDTAAGSEQTPSPQGEPPQEVPGAPDAADSTGGPAFGGSGAPGSAEPVSADVTSSDVPSGHGGGPAAEAPAGHGGGPAAEAPSDATPPSAPGLVAPEGVNSSSTSGNEGSDASAPAPAGSGDGADGSAPSEGPVGQ